MPTPAMNTGTRETIESDQRIIVAIDGLDENGAKNLVAKLDPACCRVKVGKELFTRCGPAIVQWLQSQGFDIFLDLKFHDIPNTVASACKAAADLGVWMVNVHASGGQRMMVAAREALGAPADGVPKLIAVTVLTSMHDDELTAVGITLPLQDQVLKLAALAASAEFDGVVCSAHESQLIKQTVPGLLCVTPGIRLASDSGDDQRRITTPEQAFGQGADYLVIGRSITAADDPAQRLRQVQEQLQRSQ